MMFIFAFGTMASRQGQQLLCCIRHEHFAAFHLFDAVNDERLLIERQPEASCVHP